MQYNITCTINYVVYIFIFMKGEYINLFMSKSYLDKDGVKSLTEKFKEKFDTIDEKLAQLLYEDIQITSFSTTTNLSVERGATVSNVPFTFSFNKTPTTLTFDGTSIPVTSTSYTATTSYTSAHTYNLVATGENGETHTQSKSLSFNYAIFTGKSSSSNITSTSSLSKALSSSHKSSFTVTPNDEYIYYACPNTLSAPKFNVGGFDVTFTHVGSSTYTYGNSSLTYNFYRSPDKVIGSTTVKVSTQL